MAVPEQTPYKEYIGNGVTTIFPLGFDCNKQDHLIINLDEKEATVGSWLLDTDKDTVNFNKPPSAGVLIKIRRDTPLARSTDYKSYNNSFKPEPVNQDMDNIWLKMQELGVLNWLSNNNIKDLNEYVDSLNEETRNAFLEDIRKQGISLQQLDKYVDGLYQQLANTAVEKGWLASFIADGNENQKQINDKSTQYVPYFSSLLDMNARQDGQIIIVRQYDATFNMQGGGRVIFVKNDISSPNGVTIFAGIGGNWHRTDWKEPSVFDAGLDGLNDANIKFQILYEEVSKLGLSLNLKKKSIQLKKLDLVDDTHIFNGTLDFTTSSESLRYGRSAIMSKKTDRNLSVDFEENSIYKALDYLEDIRFVNIKIKSVGAVAHIYKFNNFKLINFDGEFETGFMFKFVGGFHGTPLINDTPNSYNLIDPINGWCERIELTNCNWKGGYINKKLSFPIHFVACKDVNITGGTTDTTSGYRIDIYNKSFKLKDTRYKNTNNQVVEDTITGVAEPDAVGLYIGQNCYDIEIDGGQLTDFARKGIYVEAASGVTIRNLTGKCNNPNSVASFIDLQPNFRNSENTFWGNISDVEIRNCKSYGVLYGILSSPYNAVRSLKNIDIKGCTIQTRAVFQAITLIGMDGYNISDNICNGSLFLGSNNTKGVVRNNSFYNESNYALFVNDIGYGVYPDFDNNSFQVGSGSVIYNNSRSGYGKLKGGRLVSNDNSSLMVKGLNPGNINAEDFDFGGEKQFPYTQKLELSASEKTMFYILSPLYKAGWSSSINLQEIDTLFNDGISLSFTSTIKNGSIAVVVENKGKAINQEFNLIVSLKPVLNNNFLN